MQRQSFLRALRVAGMALQLGAASAFAQSTPPTTPSTPLLTSPPSPAEHPPTGGPNSLPTGEPANVIAKGDAPSKGASPYTEDQARSRLQDNGYRQVSVLTKDQDGVWRGSATRDGRQVQVGLDHKGNISSN